MVPLFAIKVIPQKAAWPIIFSGLFKNLKIIKSFSKVSNLKKKRGDFVITCRYRYTITQMGAHP
jgi:hypothetical protein